MHTKNVLKGQSNKDVKKKSEMEMYSSQQKYGDTQLTLYNKKKISAGEQVTILTTYPHPYL